MCRRTGEYGAVDEASRLASSNNGGRNALPCDRACASQSVFPNSAIRGLLLRQRPDAGPTDTRSGDAELGDAFQEQFAWRIARVNAEADLKTGARLLPSLAPISVECLDIGVTQRQALGCNLAFPAEQLENALRLSLADNQHRVDFPRLDRIGREAIGRFADQYARAIGLIGPFEARRQIHGVADYRIVAGLLRADTANHYIAGRDADAYAAR